MSTAADLYVYVCTPVQSMRHDVRHLPFPSSSEFGLQYEQLNKNKDNNVLPFVLSVSISCMLHLLSISFIFILPSFSELLVTSSGENCKFIKLKEGTVKWKFPMLYLYLL